ncbi:MMPL family transporter [Actinomadura sp. 9N407]|uniref:MMPL family transporter n=1 Tax=Actinomadura sp. 9N407 TaxID=3375154 RepID=UPI00378C9BAA
MRPKGRLAGFTAWAMAHRHRVLGATGALALLLGLLSLGLEDRLSNGGFTAGGTEAARADALLSRHFRAKPPDLVLLASAPEPVDSARAAAAGAGLTRKVSSHLGVAGVNSYWTARSADLRGTDHRTALLTVDLSGDENRAARTAERLVPAVDDEFRPLTVTATGPIWSNVQTIRQCREDLHRSEIFIVPLAAVILLLAFRSAFVAFCPIVIGGVVIVASSAALWLLTYAMPVSVFAPNLTTALGFGLTIDYSLFLVSRYREELARGVPARYAVQRSMCTAGRTVLFSALTVALATSSLLVFPIGGLRSLAWAAIVVVLLAAAVTLLMVPPMLAVAGHRVHWDPLAGLRRAVSAQTARRPFRRSRAADPVPRPYGRLRGAAMLSLLAMLSAVSWAIPPCRSRWASRAAATLERIPPAGQTAALAWQAQPRSGVRATGGLLTGALLAGALLARSPLRRALRLPEHHHTPGGPAAATGLPAESPTWRRIARTATRAPVILGGGCAIILLLLAVPFLDARFGIADERMLPASAEAHATARRINREFAHPVDREIKVVLPHQDASGTAERDEIERYARRLAALPGIAVVRTVTGTYPGQDSAGHPPGRSRQTAREGTDHAGRAARAAQQYSQQYAAHGATLITLSGRHASQSEASKRLLDRVRAVDAPAERLITGPTAQAADTLAAIGDALPLAGAVIATSTLVLLFLFTGGILVSVKALVLGALSLTAGCGAIVAVFQNGNLRGLVGDFTVTGHLETMSLLLSITVAFGLSVDYEVFLLSRIKEHHRATGDHTGAIVTGIAQTGRLVTVAALAVAVSIGCLIASANTILKLVGFGIALAVLVDASLVRGLLVPAFMRLTGTANWWAPPALARLHRRIGLVEPELTYPSHGLPGLRVLRGFRGLVAASARRRRRRSAAAPSRADPLVRRPAPRQCIDPRRTR